MRYRWWLIAALAPLFLLFADYELLILPDAVANKCSQPDGANKNYCPGYVVAGSLLDGAVIFLKSYSEVLTALSGLAVAGFTFTLWLTTRRMWRTSVQQIKLAREEFVVTHRPRVIVRGMSLFDPTEIRPGVRSKIFIAVVNVGDTRATVREIRARAYFVTDLENINVGQDFHHLDVSGLPPLLAGQHGEIGLLLDQPLTESDIRQLSMHNQRLVVVGFVTYLDDNGSQRMSGFARCLHLRSARFLPLSDPEYEFSY